VLWQFFKSKYYIYNGNQEAVNSHTGLATGRMKILELFFR